MTKVIYCKESVANALKAELSALTRNDDISCNTFTSNMMGMKVISIKNELFKNFKTEKGEPADAIIIDEEAFKIKPPRFIFDLNGRYRKV